MVISSVTLQAFFDGVWWNNSGQDYALALGIFVVSFVLFRLFNYYLLHRLRNLAKRTKTQWDDLLIDFLQEIRWFFYVLLSCYIALQFLVIPSLVGKIASYVMLVAAGYYIAKGVSCAINHGVEEQIQKRQKEDVHHSGSMLKVLGIILKVTVWSVVLLMVLSNMGVEITPLIASMGIGGIAVALAVQSILGDLFGAFIIYFDKPFKEGDFIIIGQDMGVVKHIGIKSTRIQALQGQELVMSNTELINSRINNYKQMEKRRIAFSFGVKYDTGMNKLKKIKGIVTKIFSSVDGVVLDRVHFKDFGDFSLNYEVVYYVDSSDYTVYMDVQEEINLKLYDAFEKARIAFAFPTQTIELEK